MKKLLFTFLTFLAIACSQENYNKEAAISVTIKKDELQNFNPIGNPIIVTLKNNSNNISPIWVMNCDYNQNFITDNKEIGFPAIDCDKNIPKLYNLKPLEEKKIKLYLIYNIGSVKTKFKIGFLMNKESTFDKKNQKEKIKIIWSNQLSI